MSIDIKQSVSPLKQRQSSRGGKSAGRATATSSRRGGFAKSRGKRGGGGRNVGGYNINTRFSLDKWKKPPSGGVLGTISSPKPTKPYSIDDKGKVVMNPPGDTYNITNQGDITQTSNINTGKGDKLVKTPGTDAVYGTRKGRLPTYREAWSANKENIRNIYKSCEDYEADMLKIKKGDKRDIEREKKRKEAETEEQYLIKQATPDSFEVVPGDDDDDKQINVTQSAVMFKMKGNPMYRNFGIGGKPKK